MENCVYSAWKEILEHASARKKHLELICIETDKGGKAPVSTKRRICQVPLQGFSRFSGKGMIIAK